MGWFENGLQGVAADECEFDRLMAAFCARFVSLAPGRGGDITGRRIREATDVRAVSGSKPVVPQRSHLILTVVDAGTTA
jgi:hypothetical protein